MEINGNKITFETRPKHGIVLAVRNIETAVLEKFIDMTKLDPEHDLQEVIKNEIIRNPKIQVAMAEIQASKDIDQTIMLSAHMNDKPITLDQLTNLKAEMYEDEYLEMFEQSKSALGNKEAKDFFANYRGSIDLSNPLIAKMMNRNRKL